MSRLILFVMVDPTQEQQLALERAAEIANLLGIRSDGDDETTSDEEAIRFHFGVEPDKIHVASGSTKQVVVEMAQQLDAELVVMGTTGRAGISGTILGNACERVLDQLSIDVLTVH